jgi:broad specificity phosphatase PhoE
MMCYRAAVETVIHLIRHGQVHNPDNVRYGHLAGFGLSERGRAQAHLAAQRLRERGITEVITSPLERAVETAGILARELALPAPVTDARLIEPPNRFDGQSRYAQLRPWTWPRLWNPFEPSWAEPFADVARRMRSIIEDHRRGGSLVFVSHQTPIWLARHAYEGAWGPPWLIPVHCTPASITSLRFAPSGRYLGYTYWSPPEITLA